MGVGKTNIEYRTKWSENVLHMHPRFLVDEDRAALDQFIVYLESQIDKPKSDYRPETVLELFPSVRLARGVEHVLLRDYYPFISLPLDQVVPKADLERLHAKGIDESYKLRLLVTEKVNEQYSGFIFEETREKLLAEIASELGVNLTSIEKILWLDAEDEKLLTRVTDSPRTSNELLPIINFHILESILKCSTLVTLRIDGQFSGAVAKKLYWVCKKSGIFCTLSREDNSLLIEITGPEEVLGKKEKYGRLIAPVIFNLIAFLQEINRPFQFDIELFLFTRERVFQGSENELKNLLIPGESARLFREFVSEYDSKVEKKFFTEFTTERGDRRGWSLLVEPDVVIMGSTIFIPDFALQRNEQNVFLEIVGFWTEAYKTKKLAKLTQLKRKGMKNLILLIYDDLKEEFTEKSTGFPVIYYSKRFPIHLILDILEKNFSYFELRQMQVRDQIEIIIQDLLDRLKNSIYIPIDTLQSIFNCYHQGELRELLATEAINRQLVQKRLIFVDGMGILTESILNDLQTTIYQTFPQKEVLLTKINEIIQHKGITIEDPTMLLQRMGFQIVWKALDAPRVILARKNE